MKRIKRSRNEQKKQARNKHIARALKTLPMDSKDRTAKAEGKAIMTMNVIGPVQAPRINLTYVNGGYTFNSGKKHRKIG